MNIEKSGEHITKKEDRPVPFSLDQIIPGSLYNWYQFELANFLEAAVEDERGLKPEWPDSNIKEFNQLPDWKNFKKNRG